MAYYRSRPPADKQNLICFCWAAAEGSCGPGPALRLLQ